MGAQHSKRSSQGKQPVIRTRSMEIYAEEAHKTGVNILESPISEKYTDESTAVKCDLCLLKRVLTPLANSVCIHCELYLCSKCAKGHERGKCQVYVNVGSTRETQKKLFVALMSEYGRRDKIKERRVAVCDQLTVKHSFDRYDSDISGLCGMDNNMLIVSDQGNKCIKIINLRSREIQRYIQFDSVPYGVTVINIKLDSPDVTSAPNKIPNMTILHPDAPSKDCAIAVTCPGRRQIRYLDHNKNPATQIRAIQLKTYPYKIEYLDGDLFVLCENATSSSTWSIDRMSIEGIAINRFDGNIRVGDTPYFTSVYYLQPDMCLLPGQIFVLNPYTNGIQCMDLNGKRITTRQTFDALISGIAAAQNKNLCVCTMSEPFQLSSDLKRFVPFLEQYPFKRFSRTPCVYRDKLFVSHPPSVFVENTITVVQIW